MFFFYNIKMVDKIEETVHKKTTGLNNPETYVITHNRFFTYLVLVFSDLNKAQIFKIPFRYSLHHEIGIVKSFSFLNLFKPNKHREGYCIRKPNDEFFLFETIEERYFYLGRSVNTFEANDIIVKDSLDVGCNDIKFQYA